MIGDMSRRGVFWRAVDWWDAGAVGGRAPESQRLVGAPLMRMFHSLVGRCGGCRGLARRELRSWRRGLTMFQRVVTGRGMGGGRLDFGGLVADPVSLCGLLVL